jgi:enterobactin synthetase component D
VISCGDVAIHWLPPDIELTDAELGQWLIADEWSRAQGFKAERRRSEYLRSRYLVRRLTGSRDPLTADLNGSPSWPESWVGSITHKDGFVGVALLPRSSWRSVGIDLEDPKRMQSHFSTKILSDDESEWLQNQCTKTQIDFNLALTCCFSFKESIYKAIYPLGLKPFYFHDAQIEALTLTNDPGALLKGQIRAALKIDASPETPRGTRVQGDFCLHKERDRYFILTALGIGR